MRWNAHRAGPAWCGRSRHVASNNALGVTVKFDSRQVDESLNFGCIRDPSITSSSTQRFSVQAFFQAITVRIEGSATCVRPRYSVQFPRRAGSNITSRRWPAVLMTAIHLLQAPFEVYMVGITRPPCDAGVIRAMPRFPAALSLSVSA